MLTKRYEIIYDTVFKNNLITMTFADVDNNTSDFIVKVERQGVAIDLKDSLVTVAVIKPNKEVEAQLIENKDIDIYVKLKHSMKNLAGMYEAFIMIQQGDKFFSIGPFKYQVTNTDVYSQLDDDLKDDEDLSLLQEILIKLEPIEVNEDIRIQNEDIRIQNEQLRVEAENLRQSSYKDFITKDYVDDAINSAILGGVDLSDYATKEYVNEELTKIDLSDYATKNDIPINISQLNNDIGYLTEHQDISNKADVGHKHDEYITDETLENKGYITDETLENKGYITDETLENKGYITDETLENKGYITDVSNLATNDSVDTKISNVLGDINTILDNINGEVI